MKVKDLRLRTILILRITLSPFSIRVHSETFLQVQDWNLDGNSYVTSEPPCSCIFRMRIRFRESIKCRRPMNSDLLPDQKKSIRSCQEGLLPALSTLDLPSPSRRDEVRPKSCPLIQWPGCAFSLMILVSQMTWHPIHFFWIIFLRQYSLHTFLLDSFLNH